MKIFTLILFLTPPLVSFNAYGMGADSDNDIPPPKSSVPCHITTSPTHEEVTQGESKGPRVSSGKEEENDDEDTGTFNSDQVLRRLMGIHYSTFGQDYKTRLCNTLASLSPAQRQKVEKTAQELFTEERDINPNHKFYIITDLCHVPEDQFDSAVHEAQALFNEQTNSIGKAHIIQALGQVPANLHHDLIHVAQILFTERMDAHQKADIIEALGQSTEDQRHAVIYAAQTFLNEDMNSANKAAIIKLAYTIPEKRRNAVFEIAQILFTEDMLGDRRTQVIRLLSQGTATQLDQLTKDMRTEGIPSTDIFEWIKSCFEKYPARPLVKTLVR